VKPYYEDTRAGITIYKGDCREILPSLPPVDLVLTDPPYGIGADSHQGPAKHGWKQYGKVGWDLAKPERWVIEMAISKGRHGIVWGGNYFELPPKMGWLVWDKGQRDFSLADCELAWTTENRAARVFDYSRAKAIQDGKEHPTQKPVELMRWCMTLFEDCKTILDPFTGSGTTLRAAKDLGRKAIGIEIEEKYCEIAAKRLAQEVLPFQL